MKKVYVFQYDEIYCYSTVRKMVEYAQKTCPDYVFEGLALKDWKTPKLITYINNEGYLSAYDGEDAITLETVEVQ